MAVLMRHRETEHSLVIELDSMIGTPREIYERAWQEAVRQGLVDKSQRDHYDFRIGSGEPLIPLIKD